ncbi:MAG: c-type cytochrome, partial [Deltaproteobacteria bacterium]
RGRGVRRTTRMMLGTLACFLAAAAPAVSDDRARTADALLDLLAIDADAAAPGIAHVEEQRERAAAADGIFEALEGLLPERQLDLARRLRALTRADGPSERTATLARTLQRVVERRYGEAVPARPPDLARGAALYAQSCGPCHGAAGWPATQESSGLSTRPTALADPAAIRLFSPRHLFHAVGSGVPETAMPAFAGAFSEEERWDVAFFAATLSHPDRGSRAALARATAAGFSSGARQLAVVTDDFLRLQLQAAGLAPADVEQALAAARAGPFTSASERLPPLILPQWLVPLAWVWQETEDETGAPVERAALALTASSSGIQRARLLSAVRLLGAQMLSRRGQPPFDLNLTIYDTVENARAGRGAVASCNLVSDEEIECDALPIAAH